MVIEVRRKNRSLAWKVFFWYILTGLSHSLTAQQFSNIAGAFAELNLGVRPASMGGASSALSNDGNAVEHNMAAAGFSRFAALSATTTKIFGVVPATYIGAIYPYGPGVWGLSVQQVGDALLSETTLGVGGAIRANKILPASLARQKFVDDMAFSVTVKTRVASFGDNVDGGEDRITGGGGGFGVDLGYFFQHSEWRVGAVWKDAFGTFRWNSSANGRYSQRIPSKLKFGMAYISRNVRVAFDLQPALHEDTPVRMFTGGETNIFWWLMIRAGWAQNLGGHVDNKIFTAGVGRYSFSWRTLRFALQTGYRREQIADELRFAIDLFWLKPGK